MKRFIIIFTTLSFFAVPLLSQIKGNISICIRDSVNKALQDVGVLFFQADSLVAGVTTGRDGCFSLSLDTGNYAMHITHLGYEEYTGEINLTPAGVRLPAIVLKETAVELDAVTVSEQIFSTKLNKSLFKISGNVKNSSTDIYQVLTTIPTLIVNPVAKTAALAGAENSIIMVNNIRRDKGYLSLINPKDIDRVEIIRNPGSRYRNVDGIINIVTKVPARGQSLTLFGRLEPTLKQGYFDGFYKFANPKVSGFLYAENFFFDETNREESVVRDVSIGNNIIHTERKSNVQLSSYVNTYTSASVDYTISSKSFVSLAFDYISTPTGGEIPYKGSVLYGNGQGYEFDAQRKDKSDYNIYKLFLYYQSDFSKNSSMSIDIYYDMASTKANSMYSESNNSGHFFENRQVDNTNKQGLNAQINFQQQLSKVRFEEGYRVYLDNNKINNETNGVFNKTDHNEWRHYFYANLLGDIREKFVYQAGLGFDMSRITLNNTFSAYNELIPNAVLRYIMKNGQNISLNYSLTRKSPPSSALNPIPNYVDSSRIITGNPDLKPYYLNVLGLSYELYSNKFYIRTNWQYNLANNYITNQENLDENGIYRITYANTSRYSAATADLYASYSIFNWWKVAVYGTMKYNMYEDDTLPQLNKNYWTPFIWLQSSINYKKMSLSLFYPVVFRITTLTGYSTSAGDSNINALYRLNKSWTVIGMIRYLAPMRFKTETFGDGFSEIYYNNMTDRYFRFIFGVRYNFQKGKQQNDRRKNIKNYNDEAEVGVKSY
jgi:hypothetical protein